MKSGASAPVFKEINMTAKKRAAPLPEVAPEVITPQSNTIRVIFNGGAAGKAFCTINDKGYEFPVGVPVDVDRTIAEVIGDCTVVAG
jgi:hypothetical protein